MTPLRLITSEPFRNITCTSSKATSKSFVSRTNIFTSNQTKDKKTHKTLSELLLFAESVASTSQRPDLFREALIRGMLQADLCQLGQCAHEKPETDRRGRT